MTLAVRAMGGLACIMGALATPPGASAQTLAPENPGSAGLLNEPGVTVASRERPDYARLGVRLGSAIIRPEVSQAYGYDDNVTATPQAHGSPVVQTNINLRAGTDLSRYGVTARLTVDDLRYLDLPKQSATNWTVALGGAYQPGHDTVSLDYLHVNQNQTPRDLNTPLLDQALAYRVDSLTAGYGVAFSRLLLRPELSVSRYDFDDGTAAGQPFAQRFRNRIAVMPSITAGYELAPRRDIVVVVRNVAASYTTRTPGTPGRDFNDTTVLAGIDYDGGGPWRYRLLGGYEVRQFGSAAYKTIAAPVGEGSVIYTPTGLTTVTGTVVRRIQDSADETTVGFTETTVKLAVDHEYLRNVLLRGQAALSLDDNNGGGGQQTIYSAGVGATWLLNRNVRLGATYDFTARRSGSTAPRLLPSGQNLRFGTDYTEGQYLLRLSLGL